MNHESRTPAGVGSAVNINGALGESSSGIIDIDIAGTAANQVGTINITRAATLNGTLNVTLANGFTPANGDSYKIMTYSSVSGTFATFNSPSLSGGLVMVPAYNVGNLTLNVGHPLMAATSPLPLFPSTREKDTPAITLSQLVPVANAAIARWSAVVPGSALGVLQHIQFQITNLQSPYLGLAAGSTIWIDAHAGGYGWFVDPAPATDAAFSDRRDPFELAAAPGSAASGHMDLLTVVMHEMGHLLGLPDVDPGLQPDQVMTEALPAGLRRLPDAKMARDYLFAGLARKSHAAHE
jgi:hypothetical protein